MASSASRQPARGLPPRQPHVAEQHDDFDEQEGEDDTEEVFDADAAEAQPSLEEVLQTEAEVLVAELEQAAEEGADDEVLGDLEASVETGAEALVSMREARARLQETRHRPRLRARKATVVVVDLGQLLFESNLGSILSLLGLRGAWPLGRGCILQAPRRRPGKEEGRRQRRDKFEWPSTGRRSWSSTWPSEPEDGGAGRSLGQCLQSNLLRAGLA